MEIPMSTVSTSEFFRLVQVIIFYNFRRWQVPKSKVEGNPELDKKSLAALTQQLHALGSKVSVLPPDTPRFFLAFSTIQKYNLPTYSTSEWTSSQDHQKDWGVLSFPRCSSASWHSRMRRCTSRSFDGSRRLRSAYMMYVYNIFIHRLYLTYIKVSPCES